MRFIIPIKCKCPKCGAIAKIHRPLLSKDSTITWTLVICEMCGVLISKQSTIVRDLDELHILHHKSI